MNTDKVSKTLKWLKIYHIGMALIYILSLVCLGSISVLSTMTGMEDESEPSGIFMMVFYLVCLSPFILLYVVGYIMAGKQSKGNWIFQLVLICFGLSSILTIAPCIYLLINMVSQEVQDYYKKEGNEYVIINE